MAIKIGNVTNVIYQTERPIHINPDGSAQGSITYKCTTEGIGTVLIPEFLSSHPTEPKLKAYETSTDWEAGGIFRVTTIYKGVLANNPEELAQHEFGRTTTEAPLETHPKFAIPRDNPPVTPTMLEAIELALQNSTPPPESIKGVARLLYDKKRRGIESFMKPGGIYKRSYASQSIPDASILAKVGKIDTPSAPAPVAPSGQNYLSIGVSWVKSAGVVTISEEHQLSGPGGWDTDIYETA